jgi:NADP-dependent 3-hydroxy acid dehydrogenase YdfG
MDTNLRGVMQLVRAVLPHMIKNAFGDIVNVSSQAGKHGYADVPSYCASKFGLLGYAEALRDHVRKTGANYASSIFARDWLMSKTRSPAKSLAQDLFMWRIWREH